MADYQGKRFKGAEGDAAAGLHARRNAEGAAPKAARSGTRFRADAVSTDAGSSGAPPRSGSRFRTNPATPDAQAPAASARSGTRFRSSSPEATSAPTARAVGVQPAVPARGTARSEAKGASSAGASHALRYQASSYTSEARKGKRASKRAGHAAAGGSGSVPPSGRGSHASGSPDGGGPKRGRARGIISKVLIIIGILLLLVAGGMFIRTLWGYHEAEETYAELAAYAPVSDSADSGIPTVDFDALQAINPDVVGWIYVPNTSINYPVVQGDDNTEYLTHLFDGTSNSSGSIFLDADATAPGMVDQQTPLYGHHMNNRSMFYEIDDTVDQVAFDEIEAVYYITRDATYRCTPLMTCVVDESFVEARQANFADTAALTEYLGRMREHVKAEADDVEERMAAAQQVLTLITCSSELPGADRTVMLLTLDETIPNA